MKTENLLNLKIHKLSQAQFDSIAPEDRDSTALYLTPEKDPETLTIKAGGSAYTYNGTEAKTVEITNVTGSAGSCTGNAATATKLTTDAGSTTQPIYFANGVPTVTTYLLETSVPANAVFTDTSVTAVGNHYTPTAEDAAILSVDASSSTAATWNNTSLVTGVNLQRDAKGHVTGITVDSVKMPAQYSLPTASTTVKGGVMVGSHLKIDGGVLSVNPDFSSSVQIKASSFYAYSDVRLKENFTELASEKSILDLPTYKFDFIDGAKNQIGCKAQDLKEICPEIVQEGADGYLSIQESKIVYLLLDEVKKLRKEVDDLKANSKS